MRNPDRGSVSNKWALNTSVNYKNQKSPDWCRRSVLKNPLLLYFSDHLEASIPDLFPVKLSYSQFFTFYNTTEQTTAVSFEPTHCTNRISCVVLLCYKNYKKVSTKPYFCQTFEVRHSSFCSTLISTVNVEFFALIRIQQITNEAYSCHLLHIVRWLRDSGTEEAELEVAGIKLLRSSLEVSR